LRYSIVDGPTVKQQAGRGIGLAGLVAVVITAVAFAVAGPPLMGLSSEPAKAACAFADAHPREIARKAARDAIVCLMNSRRAQHGKPALSTQSGLRRAAGRHSRRMARANCFSHQCPGEAHLAGRISKTSYLPCGCSWGVGENIAWGKRHHGTPQQIVRGWMHSPPHRHVLLDGDFEHVGVGIKWGTPWGSRSKGGIYTATFGFKRG
jgi:uncharacterized protein YkwD